MLYFNAIRTIRLKIPAKKASPTPPVGPTLGQEGIKINDFCKEFNHKSSIFRNDIEVPTVLKVNPNKTYTMFLKFPTTSHLLKQIQLNLNLRDRKYQISSKGIVTLKQIYEIAEYINKNDPSWHLMPVKSIALNIVGTAKSMGFNILKK